ncbi:MAG: hypothetical protein JRH18_24035 [Deltaproteobacteria bacterium]|nr:hypothetical protein [Deltaproteobacteria bacterium]MBW1996097.1 hypothetical protein [Deltaproteobacteria bacterium]MBW2154718.1 hypothetical protein [Deltaproteobacteria bacterium]
MNYRTLIIAGYGSIGSSLFKFGQRELGLFESVITIDKNPYKAPGCDGLNLESVTGDIEDQAFLKSLCQSVRRPAIFLNVATGTDNVEIRKTLSDFDVAYIDSCASALPDKSECRYSRYMPYTLTKISTRYPHILCWGINPGLVEIMTRKLIAELGAEGSFDVTIFENDQLNTPWNGVRLAVGWSPEMLVEEMMLSPTFLFQQGMAWEGKAPGTQKITAFWEGEPVPSRIVGHEDIWNIGKLKPVDSARFVYALHRSVMDVFDGDPKEALNRLSVPEETVPVFGVEKVAVHVKRTDTQTERSVVWEVDHKSIWNTYRVNAVQYQTGKSLLLAVLLLQNSHYGKLPITACASDLPMGSQDWSTLEAMMLGLDIKWKDAAYINLHSS